MKITGYLIKIEIIISIICLKNYVWARNCFIYNKKYEYESLYQPMEANGSVYTHPWSKINDIFKALWRIKLTHSQTIYIQCANTNDYLCATENYYKSDQKRRILTMRKYRESKRCEWYVKQWITSSESEYDDEERNTFLVWNYFYNESMYAPIFYFKNDKYNRNVFLWNDIDKKSTNSDSFKWIFECFD
jgi:hypothetical protein